MVDQIKHEGKFLLFLIISSIKFLVLTYSNLNKQLIDFIS